MGYPARTTITRTRDQTNKLLKNCEYSSVIFCKFIFIVHEMIFTSYNFYENSDFCKSWNGVGASLVRDGKASSFYMANVVVSILHRKDTLYDVCYKIIK